MQMKTPRFVEAQRGPFFGYYLFFLPFSLQSAQTLLSGFFNKSSRIFLCLAFTSLVFFPMFLVFNDWKKISTFYWWLKIKRSTIFLCILMNIYMKNFISRIFFVSFNFKPIIIPQQVDKSAIE
jgi:hypothetical protein